MVYLHNILIYFKNLIQDNIKVICLVIENMKKYNLFANL